VKREPGFYWVRLPDDIADEPTQPSPGAIVAARWDGEHFKYEGWWFGESRIQVLSDRITPPGAQTDNLYSLFKRIAAIAAGMPVGSKVELLSDHAKLVVRPRGATKPKKPSTAMRAR